MAKPATVRKTSAKAAAKAAAKPVRKASAKAPAITLKRVSPFDAVLRPGRYGADHPGGPGLTLCVRHPVSIVTVIARKGKANALSAAMKKYYGTDCPAPGQSATGRQVSVHWCGPEQWYVVSDNMAEGGLYGALKDRFAGLASVSDQSHGRIIIAAKGARVRDLLAKGTPVDLHPQVFAPGQCAVTQMAHVGVHIAQVGKDQFELSVFRGFAESFWEWLTEMAAEFGYEVV